MVFLLYTYKKPVKIFSLKWVKTLNWTRLPWTTVMDDADGSDEGNAVAAAATTSACWLLTSTELEHTG